MEYTKGDWKAHKGMKVTGQAGLTYVADCYPYNERMNRPTLQEAKANAQLIASAPKMVEALGTIRRTAESSGDLPYLQGVLKTIARIARETLTEAEGK